MPQHHLRSRALRLFGIIFIVSSMIGFVIAQSGVFLTATNDDTLIEDANNNGLGDAGDVIRYTVEIANCGFDSETAQGVRYQTDIDNNTTLLGAPIVGDVRSVQSEICGPIIDPPDATDQPAPPPSIDAVAVDDVFAITNGANGTINLVSNDRGQAPIQVVSFGDSVANVGTTPADGTTILAIAAGGGVIEVTINATGNIDVTANGTTGTGTVTIFYEIQVGNGTTDIGQIDITFGDFPSAVDDTLATLGAGNEYTTDVGVTLNVGAGTGLLNNDTLGNPSATLVNWGGGDASASVTLTVGESRPFAGGTVTVNADGSFDITNPTTPGTYRFSYILDNGIGTSQADVEIYVSQPPTAIADAYTVTVGSVNTSNSVLSNDTPGSPPAVVDFYANTGDIGGASQVTTPNVYTHPTGGFTVTIDAAGNLTIDATVGGVVPANGYTFDYQITNAGGNSVATVTVDIVQAPVPVADAYTFLITADQNIATGAGLLVNDELGTPAGVIDFFGGGDLSATVTDHAANNSVSFAGGTLTVNSDGSWTLTGQPFTAGNYTFDYQVTNSFGSATATVTLAIQEPPIAQDDNPAGTIYQVTLGNTLTIPVGANDLLQNTDPNGADDLGFPLATITTFGPTCTETPANNVGSTDQSTGLTVNADGSFTYTPTILGIGTHTFCYTLSNGIAPDSTANVTITVVEGPTATDDTDSTLAIGSRYNTLINTSFSSDGATFPHLLTNDTLGSPLATLTQVDGNAITVGTPIAVTDGTVTVTDSATGAFTFVPTTGFTGTASFTYTLTNANGNSTATVEVYVNEGPVAVVDNIPVGGQPAYIVSGTGPFNFPAGSLFADNGLGADTLGTPNATITTFGPTGTETTAGGTGDSTLEAGILTVNADGSFSINPTVLGDHVFVYDLRNFDNNGNFVGASGAQVTIRLQLAPTANDDTDGTLASGNRYNTLVNTPFSSDGATFPHLLANDTLGSPLATLTQIDGNAVTIGTPIAVTDGTVTITDDATGAFTFVPTTGFIGTASFAYTIENGTTPDNATVEVNVNQAPVANDDNTPIGGQPAYTVAGTGPFNFPTGSLFTDNGAGTDNLGTPNAEITSFGPTTGAETTAGGTSDTTLEAGILIVNADGSFSINPTVLGDHVFVYELENRDSNDTVVGTDTATVTIRVQSAPVAQDDLFAINFNDPDPLINGNLTADNGAGTDTTGFPVASVTQITAVSANLGFGTVTTPATVAFAGGTLTVATDGTISLNAATNPGQYSFTYTLDNGAVSDTATVTVDFYAPSVAVDDLITLALGDTVSETAAAGLRNTNDTYTSPAVYDDATITAVSDTDNTVALTIGTPYAIPGTGGATFTVSADGGYTVDATSATTGGVFNFEYTLSNSHPTSSTASITIIIQSPPDGIDDSSADVLANTSSPGDPFHVALNATSALVGNLFVDNGSGADNLGSPSAPTNAPADAINAVFLNGTLDGASGTIGGGDITIGTGGVINVATNGNFTFEPPTNFTGLVTFQYTLANSVGVDATPATVTLAVGERPTCVVDAYTGTANINFSVNDTTGVLANDAGDALTLTQAMGSPANVGTPVATTNGGTVTLNADGSFDYEPPAGVSGVNADNFTYAIENSFGEETTSCTANITLNTDAGAIPWFIERGAAGTNSGTFADPFNSIASFNAANTNGVNAPSNGDVIYMYADAPGFYNEADGINLLDAQEVYGGTVQFNTVFTTSGLVSPAYTAFSATPEGSRTQIRTTGDDAFDIFSNNIISGFTIDETAGYAFADSGVNIGTTTITDVSTFNGGGVFNLQNGGTITATLDRMSASTNGGLSVIALNGISGTITDAIPGGIIHQSSGNMFDVRNSTVSVTVSSTMTMLNSTGTGIFLSNADGTYNFTNIVDITRGSGGVNIENGSDGTLNITNAGSAMREIQGIPFRVNNSTMNIDYDGDIFHTTDALLSARVVEIVGGTGTISFDGTIAQGDNVDFATAEMVYLENTGNANTVSFNYIDAITRDTSVFVSNTSGNVSANRFRLRCTGNLTVGGDTHCVQISDTISSGFTIEAMAVVANSVASDNGGAISLVNTPGTWTIEDISGGLTGSDQIIVFGNNFGTLQINTVNSPTSSGGLATGDLFSDVGTAIDLSNGTVNINFNNLRSFNSVDHGISLVNVDGPLFRVSGETVVDGLPGSNELIHIVDSPIDIIDISSGSTVTMDNRRTTGFFGDGINGTSLLVGNYTDSNPQNSPGSSIRIQNSSAAMTVNQVGISNTVQSVARSLDPNGLTIGPNTDDGQAIFLLDNTGTFTVNGGTITSIGNNVGISDVQAPAAVDVRQAPFSSTNLAISPNSADSGPALRIQNPPASSTSQHTNLTINNVAPNAFGIITRTNDNIDGATVNYTDLDMQNFQTGGAYTGFATWLVTGTTGTFTQNLTGTNFPAAVGANCILGDAGGEALGTIVSAGTLNFVIDSCRSDGPQPLTLASTGAFRMAVWDTGVVNWRVSNNVLNNVSTFQQGMGAIDMYVGRIDGGTLNATIENNTIQNADIGIAWRGGDTTTTFGASRVEIDNNQIIDTSDEGILISMNGGYTGTNADFIISNTTLNSVGTTITNSPGIFVEADTNLANQTLRLLVSNTSATSVDNYGMLIEGLNSSNIESTLLGNTFNSVGGPADLRLYATANSNVCSDVRNNTFAQPSFAVTNFSSLPIRLHQSGNNSATTTTLGTITTVAAGSCAQPSPLPYTSIRMPVEFAQQSDALTVLLDNTLRAYRVQES